MSFTTRDLFLVVGMVFAIILMNGFFMHSGVQGDQYQESEMPELNITQSQVDLTPKTADAKNPGSPSRGFVSPRDDFDGAYDSNSWIRKDEVYVTAQSFGSYTEVALANTSVVGDIDTVQLTNLSETGELTGDGFTISVELIEKTGDSTDAGLWIVEYEVEKQPSTDSSWMSSVPVVGGLYSSGNQLASMVGWIGAMLYYGITWIVGGFISLVATLGLLVVYVVGLIGWIGGTYTSLISSAPGWSSLIVSVPGIVVSLEMVKGVITVVSASDWI